MKYAVYTAGAVLFTWLLHELAHWLAGNLLGYEMVMTLNTGYSKTDVPEAHTMIISAAGPVVTTLQAVVAFFILSSGRAFLFPYALLITCLYCRVLAAAMSLLHPNDEARISAWLGWGTFTLPVIVVAGLFILTWVAIKKGNIPGRLTAATVGWVLLFSSVLILTDQALHIRLL